MTILYPKRILLAESNRAIADTARLSMNVQPSQRVQACSEATHLLDHLARFNPDLLVLDWHLLGAAPVRMLRSLRHHLPTPDLPVIVLVSDVDAWKAAWGDSSGLNVIAAVSQPYNPLSLQGMVRQIWERHVRLGALRTAPSGLSLRAQEALAGRVASHREKFTTSLHRYQKHLQTLLRTLTFNPRDTATQHQLQVVMNRLGQSARTHDFTALSSATGHVLAQLASWDITPATVAQLRDRIQHVRQAIGLIQDESLQDDRQQDQPLQDQPLQDQPLQDQPLVNVAEPVWAAATLQQVTPKHAAAPETPAPMLYLIDPDTEAAATLRSALTTHRFDVRTFADVDTLIEAARTDAPQAILLDTATMAEGRNTAQHVHQLGLAPVVFLANEDDMDLRLRTVKAGGMYCFAKPVEVDLLVATLQQLTKPSLHLSILLVDDDPAYTAYQSVVLGELGLDVETMNTPAALLPTLEQRLPDAILMDMRMPSYDGLDLLAVLHHHPRYRHLPVIFLTGVPDEKLHMQALMMGADALLSKDTEPEVLVQVLRSRIERTQYLKGQGRMAA